MRRIRREQWRLLSVVNQLSFPGLIPVRWGGAGALFMTPKLIKQPDDFWTAAQAEANRRGVTLPELIYLGVVRLLPKEERAKLSERPKRGGWRGPAKEE